MQREFMTLNPSLTASQSETCRHILSSLLTDGLPSEAHEIYRGRNIVISIDVEGLSLSPLNIKAFRRPHIINRIIYGHLRKSKAFRSYDNAKILLDKGFHTPMPVGMCEQYDGCFLNRSYYVCTHLPFPTLRFVERHPDCEAIIDALAQEMAALHKAGIFFRDFSPGNILVEKLAYGGYRFYYIDLNRMQFGVTSHKQLMRMFRSLIFHNPTLSQLARHYAFYMGLDAAAVESLALKVHQEFEDGKVRKRALKKYLKPRK